MSDVKPVDLPGPSTIDAPENSLYGGTARIRVRDDLGLPEHLLEDNKLVVSQPSEPISEEPTMLAEDFDELPVMDDELIMRDEMDDKNVIFVEVSHVSGTSSEDDEDDEDDDDDDYEPDEKKPSPYMEFIPLDYKIKAVNMARAHPTWKLKSLQTKGCHRLKRYRDLALWEKQIDCGGTTPATKAAMTEKAAATKKPAAAKKSAVVAAEEAPARKAVAKAVTEKKMAAKGPTAKPPKAKITKAKPAAESPDKIAKPAAPKKAKAAAAKPAKAATKKAAVAKK